MKKVKIMLSAILVIALVAGALAFKAKNFLTFCAYSRITTAGQPTCTFLAKGLYSTTDLPAITGTILTVPVSGNCTTTTATALCTTQITLTVED
jgi:hypothetical protein